MTGFTALLRKELLEQWRTTRLPVVATVFVLVGLSSPLLARFTPEILKAVGGDQFQITLPTPTAADAYDQLRRTSGSSGRSSRSCWRWVRSPRRRSAGRQHSS
jgi:ABC-2 type transport system permease protein